MPEKYFESKEVESIASELILNMKWEDIPKIKFLVLDSPKSSYLGKCSKATGKWRHLTGMDFVIEVWAGFWSTANLRGRKALLYHELMHIDSSEDEGTGEITWKIKKHDVEEFLDVVEKYGSWNEDLSRLFQVHIEYEPNKKEI